MGTKVRERYTGVIFPNTSKNTLAAKTRSCGFSASQLGKKHQVTTLKEPIRLLWVQDLIGDVGGEGRLEKVLGSSPQLHVPVHLGHVHRQPPHVLSHRL